MSKTFIVTGSSDLIESVSVVFFSEKLDKFIGIDDKMILEYSETNRMRDHI